MIRDRLGGNNRNVVVAVAVGLLAAVLVGCPSAGAGGGDGGGGDGGGDELSSFAQAALDEVNGYRTSGVWCGSPDPDEWNSSDDEWHGPVDPVTWDYALEEAAEMHTEWMVANEDLSHVWDDGTTVSDRLNDVGWPHPTPAYENIAAGQPSIEDVMKAWIDSKSHCQNLMTDQGDVMGLSSKVGPYTQLNTDWTYWTLMLAAVPD